jgi:DNA repair protein RecO (recombination protein O)
MIKKIEGIVISTVDYKESSKILNIFTKDEGIIGVMARGCRKIKSKLSAYADPLVYGEFHLNVNRGMPNLVEVDVIDNYRVIRKDIVKVNYSLYLLELASQVYKNDRDNGIYKLLIEGLDKINSNYDENVITSIIELKYLSYLGIKPIVDKCVSCGNSDDIVTISSYKGGYLCKDCVSDEVIFNIKTLKLIRMFYYVDISKISKIDISDNIKREINLFIDDYYDRYSGLYLKSKEMLYEFRKKII